MPRRVFAVLVLALGLWSAATAAAADSLKGRLLIATETMADPRFAGTVIYLLEHDESGAMGLVVNRPAVRLPSAEFLTGLGLDASDAVGEVELYFGGPVERFRGFVLHSPDYAGPDTLAITPWLSLSVRPEIFAKIGAAEGPEHSLVIFGYAGWGPGQLESELKRNSWYDAPADRDLVFPADPAETWRRALERREIDL